MVLSNSNDFTLVLYKSLHNLGKIKLCKAIYVGKNICITKASLRKMEVCFGLRN